MVLDAAVSVPIMSAAEGAGGMAAPLAEDAELLGGFGPCDVCACVCICVCVRRDSVRDPLVDEDEALPDGCLNPCCWPSTEAGVCENDGEVRGDSRRLVSSAWLVSPLSELPFSSEDEEDERDDEMDDPEELDSILSRDTEDSSCSISGVEMLSSVVEVVVTVDCCWPKGRGVVVGP